MQTLLGLNYGAVWDSLWTDHLVFRFKELESGKVAGWMDGNGESDSLTKTEDFAVKRASAGSRVVGKREGNRRNFDFKILLKVSPER